MDVRWPLALLLSALLAGCSGDGGKPAADADFSDVDINVSESTGAVRGIVVDDRIVPVQAATVLLTGGVTKNTATDEQGRFVFDELLPGTYFLSVNSPRHHQIQSSVDVEAGVAEPPLVRIQVQRLFTQEPMSAAIEQDGFFECTMAGPGPWYGSAMCVDYLLGPTVVNQYPALKNLTKQNREWHMNVDPGWQSIVVEMDWQTTAQGTSQRMGIVVSTYKPTRPGAHQFMHIESGPPLWGRLDVGEEHATAQSSGGVDGELPPEGMADVSYFVGVRTQSPSPVAASFNQNFKVYIHQFYFGAPEPDWSFVAGDSPPF